MMSAEKSEIIVMERKRETVVKKWTQSGEICQKLCVTKGCHES